MLLLHYHRVINLSKRIFSSPKVCVIWKGKKEVDGNGDNDNEWKQSVV